MTSPADILAKITQEQRTHEDETPLSVPGVRGYMIVYEAKKIGGGRVRNLVLAEEEDGRFRSINGRELGMLAVAYPWFKEWATSPDKEDD